MVHHIIHHTIIQRMTYRQRGIAGSRDSSHETPHSWRFVFSPTIPPHRSY